MVFLSGAYIFRDAPNINLGIMMSEDRLIDLETKLAYQESTIEDLNLVVVELQDRVFRLEQISEKLSERLRELKPNDSVGEYSENEIPPHY